MAMTIKQEISKAKTVQVMLHPAYTDLLAGIRITVSKPEARRIVDKTPKDKQPTAHWRDNGNLVLVPAADRDP